MRNLWIVGAGGFGREVLSFARDAISANSATYAIGGFIDDNPQALDGLALGIPVRCAIAELAVHDGDVFCIALGSPEGREKVAARLRAKDAMFQSVVHPSAVIAERARIGVGSVVAPGAFVSTEAVIGSHVAIGFNSAVGHDAEVGDYTVITGNCIVNGGGRLGSGVFLGSHTAVLPRVSVGDSAKSMAGAVIIRDVAAGSFVGGNPARIIPQAAV